MDDIVLPLPQSLILNFDDIRRGSRKVEEVVTDLYAMLRPSLLSYVYYLVGSNRDAEDLIQVAFLQLFDQLNQGTEIGNLRGWLYRVVHNLAIEHARRADKRESLIRGWFSDREKTAGTSSAEDELIRRELIEKSLAALNERERHALMLRAEGLSYQEIAEILEISAKSVSVYLARALKKFEPKR
jgi:RNA polymerase sigma-70 factor, ECF subfamily